MVPRLVTETVWLVVILGLLVSSGDADDLHHISNSCTKINNSYTFGSVFQANLNYTLLTQLSPKASVVGFSNFSTGTGVDQVYALYYCRGDVDAKTCQDCVQAAAEKILQVCKFMKEAIIWFEGCTLRYANRSIFSFDEESPPYLYSNNTSVMSSYYLDPYEQIFDSMMEALIRQAAYTNGFLKAFATKEINLSSLGVLRGLAQCTPDIVGPKCNRCLMSALAQRDSWTNTMIFLPSCLIRYDLYTSVSPFPPRSGHSVLIIVLCIAVPLLIIVIGGLWIWNRPCSIGIRIFDKKHSNGLQRFSYRELQKITDGFKDKLGKGACGEVYRGILIDGRAVAVKVLLKKEATADGRAVAVNVILKKEATDQFNTEKTISESVSHGNIVKLIGYCKEKTNLALIYECMAGGDLRKFLSEDANCLSWEQRLKIAINIAEGLRYLHVNCNPAIVHRDVKPENVLLNDKFVAKLADFGLSKIFLNEDATTVETRVIFTPGYGAPEYIDSRLLNRKVDVYSFGVVLLELITGLTKSRLFNLVNEMGKEGATETLLAARLTEGVNHESVRKAVELARSCVDSNSDARPAMLNILSELNLCLDMQERFCIGSSSASAQVQPELNEMLITMVPNADTIVPET